MGLLSNRVERTEIKAGDHIYTWMAVYTYSHHGIYVGDEKVVHFTRRKEASSGFNSWSSSCSSSSSKIPSACLFPECGFQKPDSGVVFSCLNCFLGEGSLCKYMYGVTPYMLLAKIRGGTCTAAKSDPPEAVIHRATFLLRHGFGNYDLFQNNCEDFAIYCMTGLLPIKDQGVGISGQAMSMIGIPMSAIFSIPLRLLGSGPVGMATVAAGLYSYFRWGSDLGVQKDIGVIIKVPVEDLAAYLGGRCPREEGTKEEGSTGAILDLDIGSLASQPSVYYRAPPPPPPPPAPSQSDTFDTTPPGMLSMQQMSTMMYEFQRQMRELRELHVAPPPVTRFALSGAPPTPVALTPPLAPAPAPSSAPIPAPSSQSDTSGATPPDILSMQQMSMMMYEFQRQLRELHVDPPPVIRSAPTTSVAPAPAPAPSSALAPSPAPVSAPVSAPIFPKAILQALTTFTMKFMCSQQKPLSPPPPPTC